MRISDWSSDVCSSDLISDPFFLTKICYKPRQPKQLRLVPPLELEKNQAPEVNRRAGSVGPLVWVSRHLGNADRSLAFRVGRRTAGDDPQLNIHGRSERKSTRLNSSH